MGGAKSKSLDVNEIGANAPPDQLIKAAQDHPFGKGHTLLREFADALEKEYVLRQGAKVGDFEDSLTESRIEREGIEYKDFQEWFMWTEALVRESYFEGRNIATMADLRSWWGLASASQAVAQAQPPGYPGAYAQAQPAGYPGAYAQAQPAGSSGVPVATAMPVGGGYPSQPAYSSQPAVAVATPVAGAGYPSQPAVAVATPVGY